MLNFVIFVPRTDIHLEHVSIEKEQHVLAQSLVSFEKDYLLLPISSDEAFAKEETDL